MSLEDFAEHLGVSDRMVSKWEARAETMQIRPANQAALDTSLARSTPEVHARFVKLLAEVGSPRLEEESNRPLVPEPEIARHRGDGREMALVAEGVYLAGEQQEPLGLPAFRIDVYPVTNADYERFVIATGSPAPQHWPGGCAPEDFRDHPVVFVTWSDADRYAIWAGKRLPTAQEWEKAARGAHGDAYPWGDAATPAKCNTRESGIRGTTPVGRFHSGVSGYCVYDLCGNVWGWTSTPTTPGRCELKAGGWTSPFARATPSKFNDAATTMLDDDTGFRCASDID